MQQKTIYPIKFWVKDGHYQCKVYVCVSVIRMADIYGMVRPCLGLSLIQISIISRKTKMFPAAYDLFLMSRSKAKVNLLGQGQIYLFSLISFQESARGFADYVFSVP